MLLLSHRVSDLAACCTPTNGVELFTCRGICLARFTPAPTGQRRTYRSSHANRQGGTVVLQYELCAHKQASTTGAGKPTR